MPPLSIMIKPASSLCNLRCRYCFYHDVSVKRNTQNLGFMSFDTAESIIDKAFTFADGESVAFAFQGGEPLLRGIDFFRHFFEYAKETNTRKSPLFFSVQTNGVLLDDSFAALFHENSVLVGLSLDGSFNDNKFRVDESGQNSFYKVLNAANILKKHGTDFNILTVLTGYCADNVEKIYSYFKSKGFQFLQFIPCLHPFGDRSKSELYMTNEQYAAFLIKLFNLYVKDFMSGNYISVRQFDNWVRMYLGEPTEQCGLCGHCSYQFVIEGNGNIYPCDFYCTDEWLTGNINETDFRVVAASEKATRFITESLEASEKCKKCEFYKLCRSGGCKRNRADTDYCMAYKSFFASCLPLFRLFKNI